MRDLHYLHWIATYVFDLRDIEDLLSKDGPFGPMLTLREARHFSRALDFLWTVRFHLHYVAGRPEERLTFDLQPIVGARMGYTRHGVQDGVERFMRHYFLTARDVARLTHVLEPELVRVARGAPAAVGADRSRPAASRPHPRRWPADLRRSRRGGEETGRHAPPDAVSRATGTLRIHPLGAACR